MPSLIGTAPNQAPTNGDLGSMAYVDARFLPRSIDKTVDQSRTSSTTLADDSHLFFFVDAGERWKFDLDLDVGAALATTGIKIAVTVPTGAALNLNAAVTPDLTSASGVYFRRTTTSGVALDFTAANLPGAADAKIRVSGWVSAGATGGAVQLQFAQSTSNATAVTLRKGSSLLAQLIA